MAKFSLYNISLKNLSEGVHVFEYDLDRKFFDAIDGDEVRKGDVKVTVEVQKASSTFELNFDLKGIAKVPCTRCMDDMDQHVDVQSRLIVKFGKEYSEESDEIVIIPEEEGDINIAWFMYEFIALAIPIKHVHPPGECNKVVSSKLRKHRAVSIDDEEDDDDEDIPDDEFMVDDESQESDPRWDKLKGLNLEEN